jgi:hypothetical protein
MTGHETFPVHRRGNLSYLEILVSEGDTPIRPCCKMSQPCPALQCEVQSPERLGKQRTLQKSGVTEGPKVSQAAKCRF